MEALERLIRTWMATGRDEEVIETASEISSERNTLVNVVKALGEYLTSEDDELRRKGVEFLSAVLIRCHPEKLNRQSVRVLTNFYCEKLDDTETIIPALKGLVTLVGLPSFTSVEATNVIQSLFRHVNMKVLVQSVRFMVYSIIDILMARHRETLKAMESSFIAGYIRLADGEKDPRNLIVAFAIARVILIEFNITEHVESMFNITFCYFPITFRPPPNDPYGISTDDLRSALLGCLNATPAFGHLAIPVFLEKIAAGSRSTKRDTLQALSSCLPVYGAALARASSRKLWNALKLEIFQPTDAITEEEALKTTQVLVKTIYAEQEKALEADEDIQGLARDVCEECVQILREPEKSQAKPATKILCAFITTTSSICRYTISQVIPHLVKLFLNPDEILNRPAVLALLYDFITAARESVFNNDGGDETKPLLMPFKDEIIGVLTVGLKNSTSRRPALSGLKGIVTTKKLLSEEEIGFIVHNVDEIIDTDDQDDASDAILELLSTIAKLAPRHIEEQTLPILFSALPDTAPAREAAAARAKYWRVLSTLQTLCIQPQLFEILIIRLTTKLDMICVPSGDSMGIRSDLEPQAAYAHSILKTLANVSSEKMDASHPDLAKYIDRLVPRLFNLFIYSALLADNQPMVATDPRLLQVAGNIITTITQSLPQQRQELFIAAVFNAYLNGDVDAISKGLQKFPIDKPFHPFDKLASQAQKNTIYLFTASFLPMYKEVQPPVLDLGAFIDQVLTWGLEQSDSDFQRESVFQLVSSLVNKRAEHLTGFLGNMANDYWPQKVADPKKLVESRRIAIKGWSLTTKALLFRNDANWTKFTDKLFCLFNDEAVSWDAGKAIGEIPGTDSILTKRNHAVIKILFAQKFVNAVLPRIIAGAKDASKPCEQTASLVALTSLIKSIPKAAYTNEMTSLIPLILRGLDLPDENIRSNVIDTLLAAAEGDTPEKNMISEHAGTLITLMLKNSMVQEMPSMKVRAGALRYLGVLPKIVRYDVLHPYKAMVIRELAKALDDPKRSVRKEAVDTRTSWFKCNG